MSRWIQNTRHFRISNLLFSIKNDFQALIHWFGQRQFLSSEVTHSPDRLCLLCSAVFVEYLPKAMEAASSNILLPDVHTSSWLPCPFSRTLWRVLTVGWRLQSLSVSWRTLQSPHCKYITWLHWPPAQASWFSHECLSNIQIIHCNPTHTVNSVPCHFIHMIIESKVYTLHRIWRCVWISPSVVVPGGTETDWQKP